MSTYEIMPHRVVVRYITEANQRQSFTQILQARQDDPVNRLLFDILDDLSSRIISVANGPSDLKPPPEGFLENYLEAYFNRQNGESDSRDFLNQLIASPLFYHQVLQTLSVISPETSPVDAPAYDSFFKRVKGFEDYFDTMIIKEAPEAVQAEHANALLENVPQISREAVTRPGPKPALSWLPSFFGNKAFSAMATAAAAMLLFVSLSGTFISQNNTHFQEYFADGQQPYEYSQNSLRSIADVQSQTRDFDASLTANMSRLVHVFDTSMGSYITEDYSDAIANLSKGEVLIPTIRRALPGLTPQSTSDDSAMIIEARELIRDYYFYLGVSHLVSSEDGDQQKYHLNSAIRYLLNSSAVSEQYSLTADGREQLQLGIAYGKEGDRLSAENELKSVLKNGNAQNKAAARKLLDQLAK